MDGRPTVIEKSRRVFDRPLELVYLLDVSGSMEVGAKLAGSIRTISYLLGQHRPKDRWRIVVFSDRQVVQILEHTQRQHWETLSARLEAYGKTALYDALSIGNRFFSDESLHNRAILLFTDGNDNQSHLTEEQFRKVLKNLEIPVFVVGIADGFLPTKTKGREELGLHTLEEITKISGGKLFIARDVSHLDRIATLLGTHLRPQYLLTVVVERGALERRHEIEVKVKGRTSARIRHRTSYIGLEPEFIGGNR